MRTGTRRHRWKCATAVVVAAVLVLLLVPAAGVLADRDECLLDVSLCGQEMSQWCWAASSQCILAYYGFFFSQSEIALYGTDGANTWNWLWGETSDPTRRGINLILMHFGGVESELHNYALSVPEINLELCAHQPFVIRWGWTSGGGHFLVGHGITDADLLHYMDPLPVGQGGFHIALYDWVVAAGDHEWTHSLSTQAPGVVGTVIVDPDPDYLEAPWQLVLPDLTLYEGTGDTVFSGMEAGDYTLTWAGLAGWMPPAVNPQTLSLAAFGSIEFTGTYGPPFAALTAEPLGDPGPGRGAAMIDCDGDSDLDIYVINAGEPNLLLCNEGGDVFTANGSGPENDAGPGNAGVFADYDNDGDLDCYLSQVNEGNRLLRNEGGAFTDVTPVTPTGLDDPGAGCGVAWADFDLDGRIDLYLVNRMSANRLYRNFGEVAGNWFFVDVGGVVADPGPGCSAAWGDYDNDGDPDLYLTSSFAANKLFENRQPQGFVDVTGTGPLGDPGNGTGAAWGDYDNDGDLDLYVANEGNPDLLLKNQGGSFSLVAGSDLGDSGRGCTAIWADIDNDARLDLYLVRYGQPDLVLHNQGNDQFQAQPMTAAGSDGNGTGAACGDYDRDGDLDFYVVNDGGPNVLLRNEAATGHHWLEIALRGTTSNAAAIGARVRVVTGQTRQLREISAGTGCYGQNSPLAAFGLAEATMVDTLQICWPGGLVQVRTQVPADQILSVVQGELSGVPPADDTPRSAAVLLLHPPWPNPCNPATTISFDLPAPLPVELAIYAVDGRLVTRLVDRAMAPGRHAVTWHGEDGQGRLVASGTYLCRLQAGDSHLSRRIALMK